MHRTTGYLLATLLAASFAACGHPSSTTSDAEPLVAVRASTATAELVDVPTLVELRGTVEAARLATVSTRVMATVTSVAVDAGDTVGAGDLLLEIDPAAAQGQLSQATGALAQAEAALAVAERNLARYEALADTDSASELEVDLARMQHQTALGAVEQARGAVASARSVATDARVTSPFSGRVVRRYVDVGDLAAPGRPLFTIESDGARRLALAVPDTLMADAGLEPGVEVDVSIDRHPELGRVTGAVVEVSPGADPTTHAYEVKVTLPLDSLATGSTGRAWIASGRRRAIRVPSAAVVRHGGLEMVVVRRDDGLTATRAVTTGRDLEPGWAEVLSGLRGGETVLLGLGALPPTGSPVEERPS